MKLAAQEHLIPGDTLIDKWEFAQSIGFEAIELRGRGNFQFRDRLTELREARQAGVVLPTVCPQMDHFVGDFDLERRRDAIENIKSMLSVMAEIGGQAVMTPASYGMFSLRLPPFEPPRSPQEDEEVLVAGLSELAEHAKAEGVRILLEPLNRYEDHMVNTLDRALEICNLVSNDALQVVADLFHMNIEESDPAAALTRVLPQLAHVQLGDSNRLEPGAGHMDFATVFAPLVTANYDGYLAMECRLSKDPADALRDVADLLLPLLTR